MRLGVWYHLQQFFSAWEGKRSGKRGSKKKRCDNLWSQGRQYSCEDEEGESGAEYGENIMKMLNGEESSKFEEEMEEVIRLGRYENEGGARTMRVTLHRQAVMEELLKRTCLFK